MKKILMIVLNGFGIREEEHGNAIKKASMPNLNRVMSAYPVSELNASGESVGLSNGLSGNCEVGFQTLGCARTLIEPLKLIDEKIKNKSFFENDTLLSLMDYVNDNNSTLHLIGLVSNSFIHSSMDHFYAATALAKIKKVNKVVFHFITDGKDTGKYEASTFINEFMDKISKFEIGTIGTVSGRYYAMDNDENYDRVKKCYDAICYNKGNKFNDLDRCLDLHKKNDINDEYVNPSIINSSSIEEGDGVLFINYTKNDELIDAIADDKFDKFETKKFNDIRFVSLFGIHDKVEPAFTREPVLNSFGQYLDGLEFKQARISESIDFPYVTYYFDGCENLSSNNINKIMIPSMKLPDYVSKPQMGAVDVTKYTMKAMDEDNDFILCSYVNADVIAHTGDINTTIKALEICDYCIGKLLEKAEENFYDVVITSDHGNCEYMLDENNNVVCNNTSNKVPFVIVNSDYILKSEGSLSDVIPTLIDMYEISKPEDMTGESLIVK